MKGYFSVVTASFFVLIASLDLMAQERQAIILNDIIIGAEDASYEHKDVVIDGASVTIDGKHHFASLVLQNGAVVNHSLDVVDQLELLVAGNIEIDSSSKIDLSGLGGKAPQESCAGCGGAHASFGGGRGQEPYGDYRRPLATGSGGKHALEDVEGTRGGGRISISAIKLILNGSILANGESRTGYVEGGYSGAGAGGSIFLQVGEVEGSGEITAHGGSGNGSYSYGGSGGRIAIYYDSWSDFDFLGGVSAKGGTGKGYGGPGSVFLHDGSLAHLSLKNAGAEFGNLKYWRLEEGIPAIRSSSPYPVDFGGSNYFNGYSSSGRSVISQNVKLLRNEFSEDDVTQGRVSISASWLQSSYYTEDQGELAFRFLNDSGEVISEVAGGLSTTANRVWESRNYSAVVPEGTDSFDMVVRSSRQDGSGSHAYFDNIELKVHLEGYDPLTDESYSGVLVLDNRSSNSISEPYKLEQTSVAKVKLRDASVEVLNGTDLGGIELQGNNNSVVRFLGDIVSSGSDFVVDGYKLVAKGQQGFSGNFSIVNRGFVTSVVSDENSFPLGITAENIFISSNSSIDVSAKGLFAVSGNYFKSGGSHGGLGGRHPDSGLTNAIFGSFEAPIEFGVGGYGGDTDTVGTRGGGAVKLVAHQEMEIYGQVKANGEYVSNIGGGSGGSIWIEANKVLGSSSAHIEASGGAGNGAGTGGGGRIAIYYDSLSGFNPKTEIFARAGSGGNATAYGGPGTIYLFDRSQEADNGRLQIINQGINGAYEPYILSGNVDIPHYFDDVSVTIKNGAYLSAPISGSHYGEVYISAEGNFTTDTGSLNVDGFTLELSRDFSFETITVQNGGKITTSAASEIFTSGITLSATDFYISSNSYIDVSAKGRFPVSEDHWKSGGSYGGLGGVDPSSGTVAPLYGSLETPSDFGVGGQGIDGSVQGSRGGGAIKLIASNKFEVYGDILANGQDGPLDVGAGSGGSIWIEAPEVIGGSGTLIEASGGRGYRAGAGGGGRIAIYYDLMSGVSPTNDIFARTGTNYSSATAYGGPGTVYLYDRSLPSNNARLQIINRGTSEAFPSYTLSGEVDIPAFFEHLRVIIDQDVNLAAPITFKDSKVVLRDGVHLGAAISGPSYGSVYVTAEGDFTVANNDLVVDGFTLELPQDYDFESITVQNSGRITTPPASETFTSGITLSGTDVYISSNSLIDVSAKGRLPQSGVHWKSGGSYGGLGGIDPSSGTVSSLYGSLERPLDFGVGGQGVDGSVEGSRGGGAIKLVASNKIEVYGDILANGQDGPLDVGAGSGGSIWIEAPEVIGGSGTLVEASGGRGYRAGTGGGGRIAIYYDVMSGVSPTNDIFARTGTNYSSATAYGGPGTVYLYDRSLSSNNALLQIINRGTSEAYPSYTLSGEVDIPTFFEHLRVIIDQDVNLTAPITFKDSEVVLGEGVHLGAAISGTSYSSVYVTADGDFTVANNDLVVDGFTLELSQDYEFESITIKNSGKITTPIASDTFASGIALSATDFYISSNSYVDVSAKGRGPSDGEHWKSGGSYGGLGGRDPSSGTASPIFGSISSPEDFGVGGYGADESASGTRGGGAIKLIASNRFEIYGDILSNGSQEYLKGGGSGGSIWIEARELVGSNSTLISAEGGDGHSSATGGGGRVAVYFDSLSGFDPVSKVLARSGSSWGAVTAYGGPGSVYLYDRSLPANNGLLQIANYNSSSTYEPYRLVGNIDSPLYLSNARVQIEDGVHFNAPISGAGYNSAYLVAEGDFTVSNNELVVDGVTLELGQDYAFESITVQNSGKITTPVASELFTSGITLSTKDFYISSNSYVDVSGKGLSFVDGQYWKSGGSYGGLGGRDPLTDGTNTVFGSVENPTDFGVGGYGADESASGTRGGGAIKLIASNRFEIYGDILSNGSQEYLKGGGSGGSIWIEARELVGNNSTLISAEGGDGHSSATGGGGRVAVYFDSLSGFDPVSKVLARSGSSWGAVTAYGGPGSVYLYDRSLPANNGLLQIANYNSSSTYEPYRLVGNIDSPLYLSNARVQIEDGVHFNAPISGAGYNSAYLVAEGDFTVSNNELVVDGVTLELGQDYAFESITVQNSGKITTPAASELFTSGITLSTKDFYISSNSYVDVSGKGLSFVDGQYWKSGGSYGGLGGRDPLTDGTNTVFGSVENPTDFGVGGYGADESASGTRGGGAIKLIASNRFEIYGDILSNGSQEYLKGGGSGGSIWIEARELVGSNSTLISAEGGDGHSSATGGGGRVAVYFDSLSGFDPVSKVLARSGSSWGAVTAYGGPGSVYLYDRSLPANNGLLQIANYNSSSTYEPYRLAGNIDSPLYLSNARVQIEDGVHFNAPISGAGYNSAYLVAEGDFTVSNNELVVDGVTLELGQDYAFESITVQNSGKITTPAASELFTSGITLSTKDFYISSNSYVDVSGKGYLPSVDVGYKSGGSFGGLGGVISGGATNAVFGSAVEPTDFGMGGRYQDDSQIGHRGGGAIKLVADRLEHYGYIYANGFGHGSYKGAGAGGSVWLEIGELVSGSAGYIYANGGYGWYAGAGGGGRVAIYYESTEGLNLGRVQANGGGSYAGASAEHGSVHIAEITAPPRVREVSPSGYHSASIDSTIVQFSFGIDNATLDTSDFELVDNTGGAIAIDSVVSIDDIRYQIDFSETLIEGAYTLSVGPDIFGTNGLGMDQDQDGIELEPIDDKYSTQIVIDLTQPKALSLDQPVAPAVIASSNRWITLSGSREDNTAILVDGNEIVANGSGNWSGTYYLPEGESTVSVVAQDLSGNQSDPVTLIFNVDSKAPSITGANPSGSQNVAPPFITVVVTEEGSGVDLDTSSLVVERNGVALSGSIAQYEGQVQFTPDAPFLDGEYTIRARIADKLGNLSTQKTYNFVLDYTPPAPTVLGEYPSITTVNAQTFSGSKEAGSAVLVNGSLEVIESASTTWSTQVALLQGDNTIEFIVRDAAGNLSEPTTASIHYDNNPPGQVALSIDPNGRGTDLLLDWSSYNEFTNGNDIDEYRIYQSAGPFTDIAGKTEFAVVGQGTKQFRVEGLPRGTEAHFAVVAFDTQELFNPAVTSVSAVPVDVQAPDEIANLVVEPGADSLSLRWNPSANSDGDLAGYKVAFVDDAEGRVDDLPLASLPDPAAVVQYQVTGLNPANSYPIRVYAYDATGNASNGVTDAGTTLLPNPATVTAEPKSSQIAITWSSVAPYNLLKNYAVYVQESSFTSVDGLQPKKTLSKGGSGDSEHTWSLAGLKNGTTYYVAVTAINISGGSDPQVTPVAVTPVADTEGPVIESAEYQQQGQGSALFDLAAAPQLSQDGRFKITASDDSDIARVEFFVDGTLLGTEYAASNGAFGRNLTLQSLTDGDHALTVKVFDVWENSTIGQYTFEVLLAPPAAPQITAPVDGTISNQPLVLIQGNAEKGTQVQLYRDGTPASDLQLVNSYGKFQIEVTLEEGANSITAAAEYPNRSGGFGPQSAARTLELNTAIPDAPTNLTAIERELGQISLSWDPVESSDANNTIAGYNVYRAMATFGNPQQAQKLNNQLLTEPKFSDLPAEDGHYFYAVTAVNEAATESALSSVVEAIADSEGPHALDITYQSNGVVDAASGRHAPGTVEVEVQFDEPLRNKPYFALVPEGGVPLTVELSKDYSDDTLYTGSFTIEPGMRSGTAYAVMSAHDDVGNRGTLIEQGGTLLIDAQGPEVIALTLNPGAPLKVDEQEGLLVEVVARLNDEVKPGAQPTLIPQLNSVALAEYSSGISLTRDAQSIEGEPLWVGSFTLPTSAGQDEAGNPSVASLSFDYQAADDLDNLGSRVRVRNAFQVYQGDLPPLDIPQNLKAVAQPNAGVALTWDPVEEARYVLYRKAESDTEFTEIQRLSETQTTDTLPSDGQYYYAVASERRSNDQIAVSALSEAVAVSADSIAPAAPADLALELNGAGIVATWSAPTVDAEGKPEEGAALTYNLYRLGVGEGVNVTAEELQNIIPLQTGIPEPIALDANPSESQHAYAITALDEAGNESAPSDTAYLNFGLLPVSDLSITISADGNPQLQWHHSGAAIAGYRVYVDGEAGEGEENLQEITTALIPHSSNPTTFVDENFSAGAQGVTAERRYTVIAEDDQGATSIGHSLLLPALAVEVIEPQDGQSTLERGVMNEVRFRVQNRGSADVTGLKLFASVRDNGADREHQSASFSVAAGGIVEVPIVIGGYAKLDTLSELQLRLEQSPLPGETIFIHAQDQVMVGDAALRLSLESDTVYRGGLGKFRFTLENTSAVETELLMARNNGKAASDEIRIRLEDADGNLLTLQDVQQYTGDVITVASGETVARLQPGESFTSDWIDVPVPAAAPDLITVALEVDHFRYHTGKATEVVIDGNGTRTQASLQETAYYGTLETVAPAEIYSAEDTVTITGQAIDRSSDTATGNVPLTLVMELRGFERQASVIADSDGHFSYTFDPQGQSGNWRISVIHPDSLARPNQGAFSVLTSAVTPSQVNIRVPRNYNQVVPVTVKAGHGSELANVRLVSVAAPGDEQVQIPGGIHLDLGAVINLAPQAKGVINLTVSGDNLAPDSGFLYFQVLADVNGTEQVLEHIAVEYTLSESRPVITTQPSFIDTGVLLDGSTSEPFTLNNTGLDVLRNAGVELVDEEGNPAPNWLSLNGTSNLGDMGIGDSRDLSLNVAPGNSVTQGNYRFQLQITGDGGHNFTVPVYIAVVTSELGDAFFHISDIYTATLGENNQLIPGLQGAKIELQNEQVLSETRTISSDANGEALLKDLPAGRYSYRVTAFDHESVAGRLWVKPGTTVAEDVFLMNQIISVEWQVNEINLEDRYEIKLEATFETHVPVAVVMLDPLSITLPDMRKGDVFTGELSLTNYGLIRADDVNNKLPSGNDVVDFEFLAEVPDTLEAGDVVYIPYRITALRDFNPSEEGDATGAGCGRHSFQYQVSYASQCANGQVVPGGTSTHWATASTGSCSSGGGGGAGYYYGGGTGSGSGYGGGYSPIGGDVETLRCEPDPSCDEGCNKDNSGAQ